MGKWSEVIGALMVTGAALYALADAIKKAEATPEPEPTPNPTPPPPPPANERVIIDADFSKGLNGFLKAGSGNLVINSDGLNMTPTGNGYSGIFHYYIGGGIVNAGDTIIMRAEVKAGDTGTPLYDNGIGIGFDLRLNPGGKPSLTRNAQASTSKEWCVIEDRLTIPKRAFKRQNNYGQGSIKTIASGTVQPSGTSGVMNYGINGESAGSSNDATPYINKDLGQLDLVPWFHIWGTSLKSGIIRKLRVSVVKN